MEEKTENRNKLTYKVMTVGCPVNQAEAEALKNKFKEKMLVEAEYIDNVKADIYVINSCAVTQAAARKSRKKAKKAKKENPEAVVALMGCYGEIDPDDIKEKVPEIDIIIGTKGREELVEKIINMIEKELRNNDNDKKRTQSNISGEIETGNYDFEELGINYKSRRKRPVVKIQEGCNQNCSFCIVTIARGNPKSRNPKNIQKEVETLTSNGYKEIVLAGTNMGLYGRDIKETKINLSGLLLKLGSIDHDFRIRLSSLEPVAITEDVLFAMKENSKICKHLYLPLQSGSEKILKSMKRNHTFEDFALIVKKARKLMPDISIISDIIVGFPGETKKDHVKSMHAIESLELDKLHVFPFSSRPKTAALNYNGQVKPDIKERRVYEMKELAEKLSLKFNQKQIGRNLQVLVERYYKEGNYAQNKVFWGEGFSNNYAHVKFNILTNTSKSSENFIDKDKGIIEKNIVNNFCEVKAVEATKKFVFGRLY